MISDLIKAVSLTRLKQRQIESNPKLIVRKNASLLIGGVSFHWVKSVGLCLLLGAISVPAFACEVPKSYYSNVFCTANASYFLALKDSGQPVALINKQGKRVIDLTPYSAVDVNKINGGLFPVQKHGRVGYLDLKGNVVIPIIYNIVPADRNTMGWARPVSDNRIVVKKAGSLGVIDTRNRVIVPFSIKYNQISNFNRGLAQVTTKTETYLIDTNGNRTDRVTQPASNPKSTPQPKPTSNSTSMPKPKPNTATADFKKQEFSKPTAPVPTTSYVTNSIPASSPSDTSNPYVISPISTNTEFPATITSTITQTIISPNSSATSSATKLQTSSSNSTSNSSPNSSSNRSPNEALVQSNLPVINNTISSINTPTALAPEVIIQEVDEKDKPKPSSMDTEIWEPAKRDGKWGFINKYGVPMIKFTFSQVTPYSEGLAGVQLAGKWGFVNLEGELVIPFNFDESNIQRDSAKVAYGVEPFVFKNGKAWVANTKSGETVCINLEGDYVNCQY